MSNVSDYWHDETVSQRHSQADVDLIEIMRCPIDKHRVDGSDALQCLGARFHQNVSQCDGVLTLGRFAAQPLSLCDVQLQRVG